MSLPRDLYDAPATRALDAAAIEACGIAGYTLMRRAGEAAFAALVERWPDARRVAVVCGTGNNGGDGFVIADLAARAGLSVAVEIVGARERIAGDARRAYDDLCAVHVAPVDTAPLEQADVIVDALFGTGLTRAPVDAHADAIMRVNAAGRPVLAVDVPSGLDASRGHAPGAVVEAALTVSFIGLKQGLLTGDGPGCTGALRFAGLDVPDAAYAAVAPTARRADTATLAARLGPRPRTAHKGHHGHVLVIGGAPGYGGAARLCAEAAARAGAGLVSVATHPGHAASVTRDRPEIMCHAVADAAALRPLLARASVVALGPGLGTGAWSRALLSAARESRLPAVWDADALNLLADDPEPCAARIVTPHPGEAARLLGIDTAAVQADRFAAVRALAERCGGVAVLKGAGTLVHAPPSLPRVVTGGNPGMGSGGMGDVLTGIIAALVGQGLPLPDAATLGAAVHADAGDRAAAADGERGLLAGDLLVHVRRLLNG